MQQAGKHFLSNSLYPATHLKICISSTSILLLLLCSQSPASEPYVIAVQVLQGLYKTLKMLSDFFLILPTLL
jgi:hypothetical protein